MKLRIFALVMIVLLLIVGKQYVAQIWAKPRERPVISDCEKIKLCLNAEYWSPELQYCVQSLPPLTVRHRAESGKWGYHVDYAGCARKELISARFDAVEKFGDNGLARVQSNGKWGYVNLQGNEIIPMVFDEARDFNGELAAVRLNKKWGYYNASGKVVVSPSFEAVAGTWSNGLSAVQLDGRWGYINENGDKIVEPRYDKSAEFRNGLAIVSLNNKWGAINILGTEIIPTRFDVILLTRDDKVLLVMTSNRKYGYFDAEGKEIISPRLAKPVKIRRDKNGLIQVNLNEPAVTWESATNEPQANSDGWYYVDAENERVRFDENGKALLWRNGEWFSVTSKGNLAKYRKR